MLKQDAFSILIPFYNTSELTKKLLDELYRQIEKYPQTEIVLADDGSTEDMSWVKNYPSLIYRYVPPIDGKLQGEAVARNVCLDNANCEWVAWIDSDDMVVPDYLDIIYAAARKGYDYVVYSWVNQQGQRGDWHKDGILWNWNVWSYTYKRELLTERFDEKRFCYCDYYWLERQIKPEWSRIEVDKPIVIYNGDRPDSLSHMLERGEISIWKE